LQTAGFSEIFTSSFRSQDEVKLKNAFASDKGYLRSSLVKNMEEALVRNAPHADLLGVREVRMFEIGTVFQKKDGVLTQVLSLALGVSSPSGYKPKKDEPILEEGMRVVSEALNTAISWNRVGGVTSATIGELFATLPQPTAYAPFEKTPDITYAPFSTYPFASRDVAFWAPEGMTQEEGEALIRTHAGPLLVRLDLFDAFTKDGRTSFAFRLIFQSHENTLTEEEINSPMNAVYAVLNEKGCEVR
jgi:phenylalanyl-tRNA synthetase beta subunit